MYAATSACNAAASMLPGTITGHLVQQRPTTDGAVLVCLVGIVDYLEHGRTFPNQRANAGPDQSYWTSDLPREGAPLHVTPPRAIHRF
jgi:hypothetical protein